MAGYSGTPLIKKLGIKPDDKIILRNQPVHYLDWISPLPAGVKVAQKSTADVDFIHLFVVERKIFEKEFNMLKKSLKKDGMMWVSWPKKSSGMPTTVTENVIRELALPLGFVDVKVCAVSEIWSGLKLVVRKELRKKSLPPA